jgi:hypothetical protein
MFTHFTKRLERDINRKVKERHDFQVKKYPGNYILTRLAIVCR